MKKMLNMAKEIKTVFVKYEDLSEIAFKSIGYDMNFCRVFLHDDRTWTIEISPNENMFAEGELEIKSSGLMSLKVITSPDTAWKIATKTLKSVHKIIKEKTGELNLEEVKRNKKEELEELENKLRELKSND